MSGSAVRVRQTVLCAGWQMSNGIIAKESYAMNVFDMICIGVLVLYVGGYIWIHASRKLAPPEE